MEWAIGIFILLLLTVWGVATGISGMQDWLEGR